jgi:hypothetical protein
MDITSHTFTLQSRNAKTGPIPVTTSSAQTCPSACPLIGKGCYAEHGNLGMIWRALTKTRAGRKFKNGNSHVRAISWQQLIANIGKLPLATLWRHNQAGDLPGRSNLIDGDALAELVNANRGKRGFTYTHKPPVGANADMIKWANQQGFTVNLSANTLVHADKLADLAIAPVVTLLPQRDIGMGDHVDVDVDSAVKAKVHITPAGRKVVGCPATYRDDVTCQSCQLCQRQTRKVIVGFPAHGAARRRASTIASQ